MEFGFRVKADIGSVDGISFGKDIKGVIYVRVCGSVGLDFGRGVGAGVDRDIDGEVLARSGIFSLKWIYYCPKRGYFGILGNTHILVYYPIISFWRIKVYIVETMDMVRFHWVTGVSRKFDPSKYCGDYFTGLDTLVGAIQC